MSTWEIYKKSKINISSTADPQKGGGDFLIIEPPPSKEVKMSYPFVKPIDLTKVKFVESPNMSTRKGDVKYLILHHTGPGSFNGIVRWLCNKDAKASAHYVLGQNGELNQLVSTTRESWHAGVAKVNGEMINNHCSIGIEICNIGVLGKGSDGCFYYSQGRSAKKYTGKIDPVPAQIRYPSGTVLAGYAVPYPEKQITKLVGLCKAIIKKYPQITRENILTHFEIGQPEGRKNDPFGLDVKTVIDRIFQEE